MGGKAKKTKAPTSRSRPASAFAALGFQKTLAILTSEIQELYLADQVPWVIGYSGGKDSTATTQLVWSALAQLGREKLRKPVYVITTDTLVENPIVAAWVETSLASMFDAAREGGLPIDPHLLKPQLKDTFWVNLIGKGYPAPRNRFRWCTERLKIKPSNAFIRDVVRASGEAIVVLGTRKAESSKRAGTMTRLETTDNAEQRKTASVRERLRPNTTLPNSLVYSPIEDWSNDDVWTFLMQVKNPWGINNKDLLTMYQGASADGDCPLVVDSTTPSCGNSRFGCWVCTMVEQDKSMEAMIQNDGDKEWMLPLLELRNALGVEDDKSIRDFRRLHGGVDLFNDKHVPGPYTQTARETWLRKLLTAEKHVRQNGPAEFREIELISLDELHEIRRIWVIEKHEVEDRLPVIFKEVFDEEFPGEALDTKASFGAEEMRLLEKLCGTDRLQYELLRELLDVERRYQTTARRSGLYGELEKTFKKCFFTSEEEAVERARRKKDALETAERRASDIVAGGFGRDSELNQPNHTENAK
jgi:DNA sulfur modification protein DndC